MKKILLFGTLFVFQFCSTKISSKYINENKNKPIVSNPNEKDNTEKQQANLFNNNNIDIIGSLKNSIHNFDSVDKNFTISQIHSKSDKIIKNKKIAYKNYEGNEIIFKSKNNNIYIDVKDKFSIPLKYQTTMHFIGDKSQYAKNIFNIQKSDLKESDKVLKISSELFKYIYKLNNSSYAEQLVNFLYL